MGQTVAYSVCGLQLGDSALYSLIRKQFIFNFAWVSRFCVDLVIQSLQPSNWFSTKIKGLNYLLKS